MQRTFTNFIITAFIFLSAISMNAQDLGISYMLPVEGTELRKGFRVNATLYVKNYSNQTFTRGESFILAIQPGSFPVIESNSLSFDADLPAGDSVAVNTPFSLPAEVDTGDIRICAYTVTNNDQDKSNDTFCSNVKIVNYIRDLGLDAISPEENEMVREGESIALSFELTNFSDEPIDNVTVPIVVVIDNNIQQQTLNAPITSENPLLPNQSRRYNLEDYILPNTFNDETVQFCLIASLPATIDTVPTNNASCVNWNNITGIDQSSISSLVAFPIPAEDFLTLNYNLLKPSQVQIRILDVSGRELNNVFSGYQSVGTNNFVVPVSDLPFGTYFYQIQTEFGVSTGKFIKK